MIAVICIVDAAEEVDTGNECADEAEVDESNEEGRSPCGSQANQRRQSPCSRKNRHDEQDEDGCWSQQVIVVVSVNEPCLRLLANVPVVHRKRPTNMPMIGIRVTSWKMRHEAKRKPPSIVAAIHRIRGMVELKK